MVEIDKAMKFITDKLEHDTIPIRLTYSMASIAASMKRIADRMDGINGGVNVSNTPMSFYQIEQALNQIRDRLSGQSHYNPPANFSDNMLQAIAHSLREIAEKSK